MIDDLDHIYGDRSMIRLLKSLCDTNHQKTLRWTSRHSEIGNGQVKMPAKFSTTSPVCLIANEWRTRNMNVATIEDWAIVVHFKPTVQEVHARVGGWVKDTEVYGFIAAHLDKIGHPSMQYYVKGAQLKNANPQEWRDQLLTVMGVKPLIRALVELLRDRKYRTEEERIAVFKAMGYGDRATYYRWKKKLPHLS